MKVLTLHFVLAAIAISYLTLAVFSTEVAKDSWWIYGIIVGFLSLLDLLVTSRVRRK